MRRILWTLLTLTLLSAANVAAGSRMPSAQSICDEIQREIPGARFERESHIRLGRIAMTFVKPIVKLALDEDDEARVILRSIKRVDIATYRVVEMPRTFQTSRVHGIEKRMADLGWSQVVRSREDSDDTWVFSRHRDNGSISALLVVELDGDELSIVGVEGRIGEILAAAIADDAAGFSDLFGS